MKYSSWMPSTSTKLPSRKKSHFRECIHPSTSARKPWKIGKYIQSKYLKNLHLGGGVVRVVHVVCLGSIIRCKKNTCHYTVYCYEDICSRHLYVGWSLAFGSLTHNWQMANSYFLNAKNKGSCFIIRYCAWKFSCYKTKIICNKETHLVELIWLIHRYICRGKAPIKSFMS